MHTAAEVADQIASRRGINIKEIATELRQLGWLEVLEHLTTLHHENIRREIDALQTKIENLRCFQKEYEGWTYQDFRNKVHEDLKASAGDAFDEDDVSVRRMHYAAQSLMGTADHIANLEGSIQRLQASLKEPL